MKTFVLSFSLIFCGILSAQPKVFSRSVMDSCQFVYRVHSDIRISFEPEEFEYRLGDLVLRVEFFNSWNSTQPPLVLTLAPNTDSGFEWTQETMSEAKNFLFRQMRFAFGSIEGGQFQRVSSWYQCDIGRRFGEICQTRPGPWISRDVFIVTK